MSSISSSKVISPTAYARKDYAYITLSTNQTTGFSAGDPIKFNTLSAGNVTFDPATYSVTLKANKTYRLMAGTTTSTTNVGYLEPRFYNVTTSASFGTAGEGVTTTYASNLAPQCMAYAIITPTVDTVVQVRIYDVKGIPTAVLYIFSFWEIQELETFSPMVQTYQYAYVSPKLILSVSSTQAGFVLTRATGVFYKLSDGSWILDFSISFNITAATSTTLTIAGILTDNLGGYQCGSAYSGGGNWQWRADSNNNNLTTNGTNSSSVHCSGFLYLSTKPTGYALPSDV